MTLPDELSRIGAPASRALAAVGITRLSQLTQHSAADLLKLHGMGPRAITILRRALADQELSLRDDTLS
jgi:predicted flap endonuclease-1-like 5' DNA nuclease